MKVTYYIVFFLITIALLSCNKDKERMNKAGEVTFRPYTWKLSLHSLHKEQQASNSIIRSNLVFDDIACISRTQGEGKILTGVDIETGEVKWEWTDKFFGLIETISILKHHYYNGLMTYIDGSRKYTINPSTGETVFKHQYDFGLDGYRMVGNKETLYLTGVPIDTLQQYDRKNFLYQTSTLSSQIAKVVDPIIDSSDIFEDRLPVFGELGYFKKSYKEYIITTISDPYKDWHYSSDLSLYNLTDNEWVYDRMPSSEKSQNNSGKLQIVGDKVYLNSGRRIACHDIMTGRRLWYRDFPRDFLFSGYIVEDGKVIANCEDKVLYCLDAEKGYVLWEGEGAGTASFLEDRYLNGIIYFSGGSSSRIHAVDTETGKTLWRLDPREYDKNSDDWKPDIYVVPERNGQKGKIIIMTHEHAYCVEAIR